MRAIRNASYGTANRDTANAPPTKEETSLNSEIRHTRPTVNRCPFAESIISSRHVYVRTKISWYFTKMEVSSERAPSETSYCQIYYFIHEIYAQRARTFGRYITCRRVQYTTFDVKSSSSTGQGRAPNVLSSACVQRQRVYLPCTQVPVIG